MGGEGAIMANTNNKFGDLHPVEFKAIIYRVRLFRMNRELSKNLRRIQEEASIDAYLERIRLLGGIWCCRRIWKFYRFLEDRMIELGYIREEECED